MIRIAEHKRLTIFALGCAIFVHRNVERILGFFLYIRLCFANFALVVIVVYILFTMNFANQ
ncbi:MAG: hypothetical protein CL916_07140 [Deltaproteobacteria bacterium]|nr:hypothetical protein [Deltaproteobacteria bacterium]